MYWMDQNYSLGACARGVQAHFDKRAPAFSPLPLGALFCSGQIKNAFIILGTNQNSSLVFLCPGGEKAKGLYIIIAGEAQVVSASGTVVTDLFVGDLFGEVSTLFQIPCTATVRTPTR